MRRSTCIALLTLALFAAAAEAQELETRLYAPAPVGTSAVSFVYGFSTGNILLDAALPVQDAEAKLHSLALAYIRNVDVFGRSARLDVIVPFAIGDWNGLLNGQPASTSRRGFGDARARLVVNLIGAPAMSVAQYRDYRPTFNLGASVQVLMPVGQYDADRLISLGSNRWTLRTEVGASQRLGKWGLELAVGAWWFDDNKDFFDQNLSQRPLWAVQGHVVYTFRPGFWVSADAAYGDGGVTEVDGVSKVDPKTNKRLGGTLAYPLTRRDGLRLTFFTGLSTRFGADFDNVALAYVRAF